MTTLIPFTPAPNANFQFQCTLDGAPYNVICTFNPYGQRYYVSVYDLSGARIFTRPLIASPSFYNVSLTLGFFDTSVIFRESSQTFEIPGLPAVPMTRPPTPPAPMPAPGDPFWSEVVLLIYGNGDNNGTVFTDYSSFNQAVSGFGSAITSTAEAKFGGSSLFLFGDGAYLQAQAESLNLGGGDYTLEAWVFMEHDVHYTGLAMIYSSFLTQSEGRTNLCISAGGALVVSEQDAGGANLSQIQTSDGAVSFNTWHFCSATKSGTTLRLFLDGVLVGTVSSPVRGNWAGSARIGRHAEGGFADAFYGYINDLRVTRGVARYTATFAPPDAPFPNY